MQTMFEPPGARAVPPSSAAASVAPLDGPTKMPSWRRQRPASRSASSPATGTISSTSCSATAVSVRRETKSGAPALHQVRPEVRMALGRPAGRVARLRHAAAQHRRVVGLGRDDADARVDRLQAARDAEQRASGAEARDESVEQLSFEVAQGSPAPSSVGAPRRWPRSRTGGTGTSRASRPARPPSSASPYPFRQPASARPSHP